MSLPAEQGVIKALRIASAAKKHGWHGNIEAPLVDGVRHTSITAERNGEHIAVQYQDDAYLYGTYTILGKDYNMHCASVALERVRDWPNVLKLFKEFPGHSRPHIIELYRRLPFSETDDSNTEIVDKLIGQQITWYSHEFARQDYDTVLPPKKSTSKQYSKAHTIVDIGHRKLFHFIGARAGFRSVMVDTIIHVGARP